MKSRPPVIFRMMEADAKGKKVEGTKNGWRGEQKLKEIVSLYFVETLILRELKVLGDDVIYTSAMYSQRGSPPNRQNQWAT